LKPIVSEGNEKFWKAKEGMCSILEHAWQAAQKDFQHYIKSVTTFNSFTLCGNAF